MPTWPAIRATLVENCIVVLARQHLEPEPQIAFAKRLGTVVHTEGSVGHNLTNAHDALASHPEILRVANVGKGYTRTGIPTTRTSSGRPRSRSSPHK